MGDIVKSAIGPHRRGSIHKARRLLHPRYLLLTLARIVLARPWAQRISRMLFHISLRAMGVLNFENDRQSGERWFIAVLSKQVKAGARGSRPVILDVGANEGSYALSVLEAIPQADVHAFEPHPSTGGRLRDRLGDQLTVVSSALGEQPGWLELYDYADIDGSSHASPYPGVFSRIHNKPASSCRVPVTSIDVYLEELGWPQVALLKIDTEGHELRVLEGASESLSRGLLDAIQFEFNEMNVVSRSFLRDFRALLPGYRFFRLLPRGSVEVRDEPLSEIFAYQNIVAAPADSGLAARLSRA